MGLPWIELHVSLPRHRKSLHLSLLLGDERAWAYVAQAWLWCAENCPAGIITGSVAVQVLERAAGWSGPSGKFCEAATEAGFVEKVDGGLVLHGWQERASAHLAKLERDAERQRSRRESVASKYRGRPLDVVRTSAGRHADVAGNSNPNPNPNPNPVPSEPPPPTPQAAEVAAADGESEFLDWWNGERARRGLGAEKAPAGLRKWLGEALSRASGDKGVLSAAALGFLDDATVRAKDHPLRVFMQPGMWVGRVDAAPREIRKAVRL